MREARFHDPTVDDLDLAVLRHDNMGAKALVFDLAEGHFEWIEVPFQEPETNFVLVEVTTHLGEDAPPHGTMRVTGQGYLGGALRQQSRNPEELRRFVEGLLQEIVPGARLSKVEPPSDTALTRPMSVDTAFAGEGIVRRDDDLLRVPLPLRSVGIGPAFQLRERRYPLLIGAPNAFTTRSTIHVASGMEVERLPRDTVVETECLRFERSAGGESGGDGVVTVEQRFEYRCERIPPADYAVNREAIDRIQGYLADEILLRAQTDGR